MLLQQDCVLLVLTFDGLVPLSVLHLLFIIIKCALDGLLSHWLMQFAIFEGEKKRERIFWGFGREREGYFLYVLGLLNNFI